MTQIDITTPAIISRCEHIEHCAMNHHHQDADRMRALVAERDELRRERDEWRENFRALEKAIVGDTGLSAMTIAAQARKYKPMYENARNAALDEAAEVVARIKKPTIPPMFMGQTRAEAYDIGQHNACESKAELIRALKSEPAPGHPDDECQRCGSVGGFGCYECSPAPRQSVHEVDTETFNAMSDGGKWQHILVEYLDHLRPVPARFVRWILAATAPKEPHFPVQCRSCQFTVWLQLNGGRCSLEPLRGWVGDGGGWTCPECRNATSKGETE